MLSHMYISVSCISGSADGNYIMYHLSGDGLKPNHFLFSSCSINYIYKVLSDRMSLCFEREYQAFCSNAIYDGLFQIVLHYDLFPVDVFT